MESQEIKIARLEVEVKHVRGDVSEIKKDVKSLLEFRWRIYGATAIIAVICSGLVAVAEAVMRR